MSTRPGFRSTEELRAGLTEIRRSPTTGGRIDMIVARPSEGERVVLDLGEFTPQEGLVGDGWRDRGSRHTGDGSAHVGQQVALINRRFLELIAGSQERWSLAGDQLVVDLDLSVDNLRPGDQLAAGEVLYEVTDMPHTGCAKFRDRYGVEAVRFAISPDGKRLRLRGMYVRVVEGGAVRAGDVITKRSGTDPQR